MINYKRYNIKFADSNEVEPDICNSCDTFEQKYSRTYQLITDYKYFLASRKVQSRWRGRRQREAFLYATKAAIVIQRWWRGFHQRNLFFAYVENELQQNIIAHYNRAATKIQSLFRGWRTRQTVHDSSGLRRLQCGAAKDLLSYVAVKMHHLLRTYSIPGIYSLRNTHCLSKVEKLMTSMTYRFLNDRANYQHLRKMALARSRAIQFEQNTFYTAMPYAGPDFNGACQSCLDYQPYTSNLADPLMYEIITQYDKALTNPNIGHRAQSQNICENMEKVRDNFCGDVIKSMRKWHIWNDAKRIIARDIYRDPEKLKIFLDNVSKLLDQYTQSCYCHEDTLPNF